MRRAKGLVTVRPMNPKPVPPPRKPGQKVGLTRAQILEAALRKLVVQPASASVQAVAAELGVAHNSISGRLRREKTTLERELTREFLSRIARPMLPGEDWKTRLAALFKDAADECHAARGLAQIALAEIGPVFRTCPDFTEQVLYLLAHAGLSADAAERNLDIIAAALCGGLAVQFNCVSRDAAALAKSVAEDLENVSARRYPLTHRSRAALSAAAAGRVRAIRSPNRTVDSPLDRMVSALILAIEAEGSPRRRL